MSEAADNNEAALYLRAIAALMYATREEAAMKDPLVAAPEVVLNRIGLNKVQIADVGGRNPEAIRSALRRQQKNKS